jgi:hypothetical protein
MNLDKIGAPFATCLPHILYPCFSDYCGWDLKLPCSAIVIGRQSRKPFEQVAVEACPDPGLLYVIDSGPDHFSI